MLISEEKIDNKSTQSNALLDEYDLPLWKRIVLFLIGSIGLQGIALLVSLMVMNSPIEERNAQVNLITYSILVTIMLAIIVFDFPKLIKKLKNWQYYLYGFGLGICIVVFDYFYSFILNLFYQQGINENETGVRGIIDIYPVAAFFILGIIGPLTEELTYRSGLFASIRKWNKVIAYIATIIIFALIHFRFTATNIWDEVASLPIYLVSGLVLTFAYDKFGFSASLTAHMTNNLWAVIAQLIIKSITK